MLRTITAHLQPAPCAESGQAGGLELVTGRSLSVSDLMMGCAFVNSKRGQEAADEAQARATVAAAIAAGIRDFDTA